MLSSNYERIRLSACPSGIGVYVLKLHSSNISFYLMNGVYELVIRRGRCWTNFAALALPRLCRTLRNTILF